MRRFPERSSYLSSRWPASRVVIAAGAVALLAAAVASPSRAVTCTVPGTHATIQAAADDAACTTIALTAALYSESVVVSRPLAVVGQGAGATLVRGSFDAVAGARVSLAELRLESGCDRVLEASAGGEIEAVGVEAVYDASLTCPAASLLSDGFESGDTARWSHRFPS